MGSSAAGQVTDYALGRTLTYVQTSEAAPVEPAFWGFYALVFSAMPDEIASASVRVPLPPPAPLPVYDLLPAIPTLRQFSGPFFTSEAEYLANFPGGSYLLSAELNLAVLSAAVAFPVDLYSANIPTLVGDSFTRLQGMNAGAAYAGELNGFALPPGTNDGATNLTIIEDGQPGAAWIATLPPEATGFAVPAGTLAAGRRYSLTVAYLAVARTPSAGFGAATESLEYTRSTTAAFTTAAPPCNVADIVSIGGFPPPDGELTVDDYTSFINAFAGDDLLADIVSIGGFPPADGELTVDDYTSFINAFAEGC